MATLSGATLNDAVNRLGGQVQGSFAPVGFEAGDLFLNLMLNPHVEGRAALSDVGAPSAYADDPAATSPAPAALTPPARSGFTPQMAIWGAAYGGGGSISGSASGAAGVNPAFMASPPASTIA